MTETQALVLIIFVAVGVVVHIATMIALYATVRSSAARVQTLAEKVESTAMPALQAAQTLIVDSRPKLTTIVDNLAVTSATLRGQMERLDATVNDIVDRTRLQVIRADEIVTRTMDKVEETTEIVQHTVVSPVRHIAGILQGITAGVGAFVNRGRRSGPPGAHQDDEMFI